MDPMMLDRIETFVKANRECTEDDVATALDIHIFDALEGLGELQRLGRLRSEPIETEPAPEPLTA